MRAATLPPHHFAAGSMTLPNASWIARVAVSCIDKESMEG
jgi:hypothetical protein